MCNDQADSPLYVWPDVWSCDLQVWSFMTPNVLTEIRCHTTTQTKPITGEVIMEWLQQSALELLVCIMIHDGLFNVCLNLTLMQ